MSFVTDEFVVFYIIVAALYFLIPHRHRWKLLLASSYFFYGYYRLDYLLLFIFITVFNFTLALLIDDTPKENTALRRVYFLGSIVGSLAILFVFKYFNFVGESINALLTSLGTGGAIPTLHLLLPIGISFHIFQAIGHTIDVYNGRIEAERHLGIFATFNAFFPQLVAGPIERASHLLPQFRVEHHFDYDRAVSGLRMVLWGAFKKIVIADRLAAYVNTVYNNAYDYTGIHLILATFFFAVQIYCDFSGYSDIAIGVARIIGFDMMINFKQPYFSRSIREFWRRWHISLSTWFRDYVYFPMGGNRVPFLRNLFNLFFVFLISGLWHGASWTFVIWGALHGGIIIAEELIERIFRRGKPVAPVWWRQVLSTAITFGLVMFAWIFFRANSLDDALYVVRHLFDFSAGFSNFVEPFSSIALLDMYRLEFMMAIMSIAILFVYDGWSFFASQQKEGQVVPMPRVPTAVRWLTYYAMIALVLYSASTSQPNFIYFQF